MAGKKPTSKLFQDETEKKEVKTKAEVKETQVDDGIVDVDLSPLKKKRFRINGDNSKILELNPTDMGIAIRLSEAYPQLNKLMDDVSEKISTIGEGEDEDTFMRLSEVLKDIDQQMREKIDYIFDANVSEICASEGSMWDPIEGQFRYEHIIEKLSALYETNLNKEFMAMKRRVEGNASKYATVKKYHK